ncbi:MAG: hypothetical protein ABR571_07955 [Jatrophihabitans sp.]|uniref:hypothetical protein n=1 Tax=Jatrophihabitans sp. TaxID=1932789 RepID=UPI00391615B6
MSDQIGFSLRDGMDLAGVNLDELWVHYVAVGGVGDEVWLAQRLAGVPCGALEHDRIAQALLEIFVDQGAATFPVAYSDALPPCAPTPVGVMPPGSASRSAEVRRDAAAARLRSAAAAREAAKLHRTAAQLMQASSQFNFARHASDRAQAALQRAKALTAA